MRREQLGCLSAYQLLRYQVGIKIVLLCQLPYTKGLFYLPPSLSKATSGYLEHVGRARELCGMESARGSYANRLAQLKSPQWLEPTYNGHGDTWTV